MTGVDPGWPQKSPCLKNGHKKAHTECVALRDSPLQILEIYLGFHDYVDDAQLSDRDWMAKTPVLDDLLRQLTPETSSDSQRNAAQILSQAAQAHRLPLSQRFTSKEFLSKIFDLAFSPDISIEVRSLFCSARGSFFGSL